MDARALADALIHKAMTGTTERSAELRDLLGITEDERMRFLETAVKGGCRLSEAVELMEGMTR